MSNPDGVSRGIPEQWLPENQDETVRYTTIATDLYTVDDEGNPGEVTEEFVLVAPNGPAVPADEAPEANVEPEPFEPANPVPDPLPMAQDGREPDDELEADEDAAPAEEPVATDDPVNDVEAPVEAEPEEEPDVPAGTGE